MKSFYYLLYFVMFTSSIHAQSTPHYTAISQDNPDVLRQLNIFPSKGSTVTLTSKEGQSLQAVIRSVDLQNKSADIFTSQPYTISFDILDEASQQILIDYSYKEQLNTKIQLQMSEVTGEAVPNDTKGLFLFQTPPAFSELTGDTMITTPTTLSFKVEFNSLDKIEGVDILAGARVRRSIKKDNIKTLKRADISGNAFSSTIIKNYTVEGPSIIINTDEFLISSGELEYSTKSDNDTIVKLSFAVDDRIDSYYFVVLYKGEPVYAILKNTGSLKQVEEQISELKDQ